jgi:hypothetical protein
MKTGIHDLFGAVLAAALASVACRDATGPKEPPEPPKTIIVDSLATIGSNILVRDGKGDRLDLGLLTFVSRRPTIAAAVGDSVTGVRTGQAFLVATETKNAAVSDSSIVIVTNIGAPAVYATLPRFDFKADTTLTITVIVDMRSSGERLGGATLQATWDSTVLKFVGHAEASSGVGATVNAANAATGTLTMAMANVSGFAGAVGIRSLTFKASAVAGRSGQLAIDVIDLVGAGPTAPNFVSAAVSPVYPIKTR